METEANEKSGRRATLARIATDLPREVHELADGLERDLLQIQAHPELSPEAKDRKAAERRARATNDLNAIEERDVSQALQPILCEEGELRAALKSQVSKIGADKTEYEKQTLVLQDVARRLERQERRCEAQSTIVLLEDADASDVQGAADDALLLDDAATTPLILKAAARRLAELAKANPENQSLMALALGVQQKFTQYRRDHPPLSARMREITSRKATTETLKRQDYRNVRTLLRIE